MRQRELLLQGGRACTRPSSRPSVQVGFIPVFEVLVSTISCSHHEHFVPDEYWLEMGYECFAGAHLAILIVAYLLAFAFAIFVGVFTFVFVDSNPLSPGLKGASSGRSALYMLLWKVVLILLIEAIPEYLGTTACSAVVVIAGALWMLNILWCGGLGARGDPYLSGIMSPPPSPRRRYMPATAHFMNQLQLAMASVFTFTAVAACVGAGVYSYDAAVSRAPARPGSRCAHPELVAACRCSPTAASSPRP